MARGTRMTRDDLIQEVVSNTRLHPILLDYLARNRFRSPFKGSGSYKNMVSSLSDEALDEIYHVFVRGEFHEDKPGMAEEWKLANHMLYNPADKYIGEQITQVKIDYPLPAKAGGRTHKLDVVLLDKNDSVLAIGEAKARSTKATKDDIAKWFDILDEYLSSPEFLTLSAGYYVSLSDYKEDALRTVKERVSDFGREGWGIYAKKLGFLSKNKVFLTFLEERGGKFNSAL